MAKSFKKSIRRVFNHIDPLFMYIPLVYYVSKVYQWSHGDAISVWQTLWNEIQLIFGDYLDRIYGYIIEFCEDVVWQNRITTDRVN